MLESALERFVRLSEHQRERGFRPVQCVHDVALMPTNLQDQMLPMVFPGRNATDIVCKVGQKRNSADLIASRTAVDNDSTILALFIGLLSKTWTRTNHLDTGVGISRLA